MKYLFTVLLLLIFIFNKSTSQSVCSLTGKIIEDETNETLTGATIQILNNTKGTISEKNGAYFITLPKGKYSIKVSFIGFISISDTIDLVSDTIIDFKLKSEVIVAENIIISARNPDKNISRATTSYIELSNKEIKQLPSLMGESDVLRLIQLSPGVQSANEGNSGFYVRGGSADQNLILLDNAPVYNPSHVLGFFSVFNSDIVKDVTLIKSGISAKYGGRMSSIVDIKSNDADFTQFLLNGSIGLISSKITVSMPIIRNKIGVVLAVRRSYLDEVFKPIIRSFVKTESSFYNYSRYSFYDLNGKISARISQKDRLNISCYYGRDKYKLTKNQIDFNNLMHWGNSVITATHNRMINENWYLENSVYYSNYQLQFTASQPHVEIALISLVEDIGYKFILNKISNNNVLNIGVDYQFHHFVPNKLEATANGLDLNFGLNRNLYSHETAIFCNYDLNFTKRFSTNTGLRFTYYLHTGPYSELIKNSIGETTDTFYYRNNEIIKQYKNIEPRLIFRYQLTMNSAIKGAYTRHVQYIHLASASSITLPTDVWLPSTERIKPQKSNHYTLGYYINTKNKHFNISVETYYKDLFNQIELLHGIINDLQDKIFEESMVFGSGRSYGLEFYIRKLNGKATGWLSYTISRSEKKFDEIEQGRIYPAEYDRTHDFNVVFNYSFNEKWSFSGTFIYATGKAMTIPEYKYLISGNAITGYSQTNSFRMPSYHRLDVSLAYNFKKNRYFESSINLSIFNVYNRANPYFIYFEITGNINEYNLKITPKQVTLFPIIPSLSYIFKF